MKYDILFEPVKIGPVTAPNRFYAVPHATGHGYASPHGSIALRATKAEGGWGTVAVQITEVGHDSDLASHPMERIWDDAYLPQHAMQVNAIKKHGALAAIELAHGGMRARNFTTGAPVVGPSDLPILRAEIPVHAKAMTKSDIRKFRRQHRRAADNAKKAGYDILYVYAAHDISLLSNFLSRRTNYRSDEYGGTLENRARLLREVVEDTLEAAMGECAVAIRFSVHEVDVEMALTHHGEGREVVEMLADLPDLWDVNLSPWAADSATSRFAEEGYQLDFTAFVKQLTGKPVVGVGRFTSPDKMASLIKSGQLDLIGAARPSIADPFLPNKVRDNRIEDIRECIGCNVCVSMDAYGVPLRCTQNPTISEEWRRGWHPEYIPATRRVKNILIVGAGPAGLECAWVLARAGHQVTVAEAADVPGGRVTRESALSGLSAWRRVRDYRVSQLQRRANVNLYLASALTAADLREFGADRIVIATGATWCNNGVGRTRFVPLSLPADVRFLSPEDIMSGVEPEGPVLIYDDDHYYMASVLAEDLRAKGHAVSYATPLESVACWTAYTLEQGAIIKRLKERGIGIHVNATFTSFDGNFVQLADAYATKPMYSLPCRTVVFVGARLPNKALFEKAAALLSDTDVVCAGDCLAPGAIQSAVFSGHCVAREIIEGAEAKFRLEKPEIRVVSAPVVK